MHQVHKSVPNWFKPTASGTPCEVWITSLHPAVLMWPGTQSFYLEKGSVKQQKYIQVDGQAVKPHS